MSSPTDSKVDRKLPQTHNTTTSVQRPCHQWMQGNCKFGMRCRFRHDEKDKGINRNNQARNSNLEDLPEVSVGPKASFRQNGPGNFIAATSSTSIPVAQTASIASTSTSTSTDIDGASTRKKQTNSNKICKYYQAGTCNRGANCKFKHVIQVSQVEMEEKLEREKLEREAAIEKCRQEELEAENRRRETVQRQQAQRVEEERRRKEAKDAQEAVTKRHQEELAARREREAAVVEKYIVLDSSLIECGAGLEIRHVITGFDLCRITIKNLPRNATREEIADIFRHQGVESSKFFILQVKPSGNKLEAAVLANADQGQAIAAGLEGIDFREEVLSFEVSDNANWNTMGSSTRNSPFLTISWWVPSETIVVTYSTLEEAQTQARALNSKTWKGRRLRATMNDRPNSAAALRFYRPESIKLMGCAPGTGSDYDFYEFVGSYNTKVLQSVTYDQQDALRSVREHLSNCSGVDMDSYEVLSTGDRIDGEAKIKVQFSDWDEAKKAHDFLDKKRLGFQRVPILRSWLPKPLQYTIVIPRQQFEAQKRQWDSLSEKRPGSDAHVNTRIGDRGDVFVRVLGQDKKAAGPLKVRVESMVAGEKLDSTTHWHPSFASPRSKAFFDRIYNAKTVHVRNDFKTRSLKIYGEASRIEEARQMVEEEVQRLAQMETTRVLDRPTLRFFIREGLGKLKELLGEENVILNVATTPAKITIKGGGEANHHLQRLVDESRRAGLSGEILLDGDNETCPICTDNVSHPEQLGCGHTYCSACLKHFLTSATEFPLVCIGNENTCKIPIALPFIIRFLPPQIFQNHIESAFASYLEKHAKELKYCTTPDCTQIYRRQADKVVLQCPSCFSSICPACDEEAHEGMTCEQRRVHKNPALQERLNDELAEASGWKKCPQCAVLIEKTEGCNHMECRCGAHICWRCMGIFEAGTIYPHMRSAHGGIHDQVPAGVNLEELNPGAFFAAQVDELARLQRERELAQEAQRRRTAAGLFGMPGNAPEYATPRRTWHDVAREAQEAQARRRRLEEADNERARHQTIMRRYQEQVREEAALAERRRREAENQGGWGCVVM